MHIMHKHHLTHYTDHHCSSLLITAHHRAQLSLSHPWDQGASIRLCSSALNRVCVCLGQQRPEDNPQNDSIVLPCSTQHTLESQIWNLHLVGNWNWHTSTLCPVPDLSRPTDSGYLKSENKQSCEAEPLQGLLKLRDIILQILLQVKTLAEWRLQSQSPSPESSPGTHGSKLQHYSPLSKSPNISNMSISFRIQGT